VIERQSGAAGEPATASTSEIAGGDTGFDCDQPAPGAASRELQMLELVNELRERGTGCDPASASENSGHERPRLTKLELSADLSCAARRNSHEMARTGVFAHRDVTGAGPHARSAQAGFKGSIVLENLAWGQPDPQAVLTAWLASPGHCRALFSSAVQQAGVGLALGAAQKPFWTLLLGGRG
jgi:uncharacterized protein YkwD